MKVLQWNRFLLNDYTIGHFKDNDYFIETLQSWTKMFLRKMHVRCMSNFRILSL